VTIAVFIVQHQEGEIGMEQPLYVNVASSVYVLENFVNLDNSMFIRLMPLYPILRPLLRPGHVEWFTKYKEAQAKAKLVRHDCRKPLPYAPNTVDHILCSHFLEHVYFNQAQIIVADFYKALKPGGTLHMIVPDLAIYMKHYAEPAQGEDAASTFLTKTLLTHPEQPSVMFRFLEFTGGFGLQHRWMYDHHSMKALLEGQPFNILDDNQTVTADYRKDDGISLHFVAQKPA
jgi:predicted SAM-dependent methyltransferase